MNRSQFGLQQIAHLWAGVVTLLIEQRQLLDFSERKTKFLGVLNEEEIVDLPLSEQSEATGAARWLGQQSNSLIKADGIDAEAGLLGNSADLNSRLHLWLGFRNLEFSPGLDAKRCKASRLKMRDDCSHETSG